MIYKKIICPKCKSDQIIKAGKNKVKHISGGVQRYKCKDCRCVFEQTYKNIGGLPEVKAKICDMSINGSGIRDTARVLKISASTVIDTLKKSHTNT